jgi:succinyl-CoA synthetase beta subunit
MNLHEYQPKQLFAVYVIPIPTGRVVKAQVNAADRGKAGGVKVVDEYEAVWAAAKAPPGKRMGHTGAIVADGKGPAAAKVEGVEAAGIGTVHSGAAIAKLLE